MKLSVSSVVTWNTHGSIREDLSKATYRARLIDLDDDDAPTKLQPPPSRGRRTRPIDARP